MARYLILLTDTVDHWDVWDAMVDVDQQEVLDRFGEFVTGVRDVGSLVAGEALAPPTGHGRGPRGAAAEPPAAPPHGMYLVDVPDDQLAGLLALLPAQYGLDVRECPYVGVTPR